MLKLTFCLHRLSTLSPQQFHDYWLNRHGPLVRRLQPALKMTRYVQLHSLDNDWADGMRKVRGAPEPYDGVAELWWNSDDDYLAGRRDPAAREAGRQLLEDEARFIDLPRSPLWLSREHVLFPRAEGAA